MSIKPYTEEVKKPYAPEPRALTPPTPPDMDEVKNDIVGQIKDHIDSCNLYFNKIWNKKKLYFCLK